MLSLRGHRYLRALITRKSKFIQDNNKYKTKTKKMPTLMKEKKKKSKCSNTLIMLSLQ